MKTMHTMSAKEFYYALFSRREGPRSWSAKRLFKLSMLLPLFETLRLTNRIALWMDTWMFPSFKDICVERPVMIVSMPRCGTTYLHHTLAAHEDLYTTMRTWEMVFAPSIVQRKMWGAIGWIDAKVMRGMGQSTGWKIVELFTGDLQNHHIMELDAPEEDEIAMLWYRATAMLLIMLSDAPELNRFAQFGKAMNEESQDRWMKLYKGLIQRHLYAMDPDGKRQFLAKNPFMITKSAALKRHFPDAQVITNLRCPIDSFKSAISNSLKLIETFASSYRTSFLEDMLFDHFIQWQRAEVDEVAQEFAGQHHVVRFPELISNSAEKCKDLALFLGIKDPILWPINGGRKHATHATPIALKSAWSNRIRKEFPERISLCNSTSNTQ